MAEIYAAARESVGDLTWLIPFVQPRGDGFALTYPLGTPNVDIGFENLSRSAGRIWCQYSRVERADWENALRKFISLADGAGIEWALIGGVSLAIRGVAAAALAHDVDIITTQDGASQLSVLIRPRLTGPILDVPTWGAFGRAFMGATIEWLGNDAHDQMWRFNHPWEEFEWEGRRLLVPSLELYLKVERARGRADRVHGIEALLSAS